MPDGLPPTRAILKKAPVYEMTPNVPRIVEAILHVVTKAQERGVPLTQYDIVKSLFLADRAHLNRYGRPITYDNYVAMLHGPVPSLAYDILKENRAALRRHAIATLPWVRKAAPELGKGCFAYSEPQRRVDGDVISPSDMEELSSALVIVKSLGFKQVRKLTHEDQAYLDAWEDSGQTQRFPMSYSLLFDVPNAGLAQELAFLSKHV